MVLVRTLLKCFIQLFLGFFFLNLAYKMRLFKVYPFPSPKSQVVTWSVCNKLHGRRLWIAKSYCW